MHSLAASARKGFTLVELMIVIAIVGILLAGTYVPYRQFSISAQVREAWEKFAQGVTTSKTYAANGYSLVSGSGRAAADVAAIFSTGRAEGWAVPHVSSGSVDFDALPALAAASGARIWSVELPSGLEFSFSGASRAAFYWTAPYGTLSKSVDGAPFTGSVDVRVSAGPQPEDGPLRKTVTVK